MLSWLHQKRGSARDFWLRRSESSSGEEKHVTACLCRSLSSLLPLNPSKSRLLLFLWPSIPPCAHVSQTSTAWTHEVFARGQDKVVGLSLLCMFPFWPFKHSNPLPSWGRGQLYDPYYCMGSKCIHWLVSEKYLDLQPSFLCLFCFIWGGGLWRGGGIVWNLEGLGGENCDLPVEPFLPVCLRVQREMSRPNRTKRKQKSIKQKQNKKS